MFYHINGVVTDIEPNLVVLSAAAWAMRSTPA